MTHHQQAGREKLTEEYDAGEDFCETADQLEAEGYSREMSEGIARQCVRATIERRRTLSEAQT